MTALQTLYESLRQNPLRYAETKTTFLEPRQFYTTLHYTPDLRPSVILGSGNTLGYGNPRLRPMPWSHVPFNQYPYQTRVKGQER